MILFCAIAALSAAPAADAPPSDQAAALMEITPGHPARFELEAGTLRLIGCDLSAERLAQGHFFSVTLYFDCMSGAVQPFRRDAMVSLNGVDIARFPIMTKGKQPGEVFKVSQNLYVPRCVQAGTGTLSIGLVRENAPGEGRRGLTNTMAELARVDVAVSPAPPGGAPAVDADANAAPNMLINGEFEDSFKGWNTAEDLISGTYGWQHVLALLRDGAVSRRGGHSLCIAFGGGQDPDLYHVSQIVAVKPSTRYQISYWAKTEELQSKSLPLVAVGDADRAPGEFYAAPANESIPKGTTNWTHVSFDFMTPAATHRLVIRISRSGSGPATYDPERFGPIRGTIWLDDIRLSEVQDGSKS